MKRLVFIFALILSSCVCQKITIIDKTRFYAHGFYNINGVKLGATDKEAYNNIVQILSDTKNCGYSTICVDDFCCRFYKKEKGIYGDILDECYEDDETYDYKKELKILKGLLDKNANQ